MRWMGTLVLLLAGCSFNPPEGNGGGGDDAAVDAPVFDPDCVTWQTGAKHIDDPCRYPTKKKSWVVSGSVVLDTANCRETVGDAAETYIAAQPGDVSIALCVLSVESFSVAADSTLRVIGDKPLLILSRSTIDIVGKIDVSSTRNPLIAGAGARTSGCQGEMGGGAGEDFGGGGGGGYQAGGGDGGDGNGGREGGDATGSIAPVGVQGGCPGGDGGSGAMVGRGGAGGGAVQLTAEASIVVRPMGRILAGGMGGSGAVNGGGGGGGSGGFVGLDARSVTLEAGALIAANGGAGGTGCDMGPPGPVGEDGQNSTLAAIGGTATVCNDPARGGNGGALAARVGAEGSPTPNNGGGGGGGGGVGFILHWGAVGVGPDTASPAIVAGPRPMP